MKKVVLLGAGGFGREVALIIERINKVTPTYELLGFLDDADTLYEGMTINGYPFLGRREWILEHKEDVVCVCSIGKPSIRRKVQTELMEQGVTFETIIAPDALIGTFTEFGPGCVVYAGVSVSVNCKIGAGVLLSRSVSVGHDTIIGDFTSVFPATGFGGYVKIGPEVSVGAHSYIIPGKKVGDKATVAAGSIVFSNVKAGTTVLGNPAKRMRAIE